MTKLLENPTECPKQPTLKSEDCLGSIHFSKIMFSSTCSAGLKSAIWTTLVNSCRQKSENFYLKTQNDRGIEKKLTPNVLPWKDPLAHGVQFWKPCRKNSAKIEDKLNNSGKKTKKICRIFKNQKVPLNVAWTRKYSFDNRFEFFYQLCGRKLLHRPENDMIF